MKIYMPVLLASCLIATQGFAGGLADPIVPVAPPPPPPVVIPLDWYVGLQAGIVSGEADGDDQASDLQPTDFEGPIYGVHAGVQRSFGSYTVGAEIDWNTTDGDLEDSGTDVVIEMDTLAHLKLRVGTNVGNALVYGTAGLAYASMTFEPFPGSTVEVADTAPFVGIGADLMVSQSISVGGEVLIHRFEDMDGSDIDVDFNTAMLRVSYHF